MTWFWRDSTHADIQSVTGTGFSGGSSPQKSKLVLSFCSRRRLAGPDSVALTATPAPPHCGGVTLRENQCVTPVAST